LISFNKNYLKKDEPFFMLRDDAANYTGNDRFIGYCVDLTKRLAEIVNFTYEFSLVKDNKFGARGEFFF
jgi:hypothetical protein